MKVYEIISEKAGHRYIYNYKHWRIMQSILKLIL